MRNGEWPISPSNNWVRLGYCALIPSGRLYKHYVMARKLYRRIFYCYGEVCEAWRTRPTEGGDNVRVIHAVRMRIKRYSADVLARDLIPNTVSENSADQTIFQFLNYGNS
jgi:hypothetical protein